MLRLRITNKAFWIACGSAMALLVACAALAIYPLLKKKWTIEREIANQRSTLNTIAPDNVHGLPEIDSLDMRRKDLLKDYRQIIEYCVLYDNIFERWFKEVYIEKIDGENITGSWFGSKYKAYRQLLENKLKEKMGARFHLGKLPPEEDALDSHAPGEKEHARDDEHLSWEASILPTTSNTTLHKLQKRYWLREMVANAIVNSQSRIVRLEDIVFPEKPADNIEYVWQAAPDNFPPEWGKDFKESPLPDNIGTTITFGVVVHIYYSDIPKFVNHLLYEAKPEIPDAADVSKAADNFGMYIDIKGCRIDLGKQLLPRADQVLDAKDLPPSSSRIAEAIHPEPVRLVLLCEVLDFDIAKLKEKGKKSDNDDRKKE